MYQTLHRNLLRSQWRPALHNRMRRRSGLTAQAQIALILALLMAFGPAVPLARAQSGASYVPQEACPNGDCENVLTVDLSGIVTNPVDPTLGPELVVPFQYTPRPEIVITGWSDYEQERSPLRTGGCPITDFLIQEEVAPGVKAAVSRGIGLFMAATEVPQLPDNPSTDPCKETSALRLIRHKRSDARAAAFLGLLMAATGHDGSTDGLAVKDWLAKIVRRYRKLAAKAALANYDSWAADPCRYVPPSDYDYDKPARCYSRLLETSPFSVTDPAPDFKKVGALEAYSGLRSSQGTEEAKEAAAGLATVVSGIAAGTSTHLWARYVPEGLAKAFVNDVFPSLAGFQPQLTNGNRIRWVTNAELAKTARLTTALRGFAGPIGVLVGFVMDVAFSSIDLAESASRRQKLEDNVKQVFDKTVDISALLKKKEGRQEIFSAFLETTLFDGPDPIIPVPAQAPSARQFVIENIFPPTSKVSSPTLNYLSWTGTPRVAYLDNGWFVSKPVGENTATMDYFIDFLDDQVHKLTAQIAGEQFWISDEAGTLSYYSTTLRYFYPLSVRLATVDGLKPAVNLFHTQKGASSGHADSVMDYKSWDGYDWRATVDVERGLFTHRRRDGGGQHTDKIINYVTWDGGLWTARVDPVTRTFHHTRKGSSSGHQDANLAYVNWSGTYWMARIQ